MELKLHIFFDFERSDFRSPQSLELTQELPEHFTQKDEFFYILYYFGISIYFGFIFIFIRFNYNFNITIKELDRILKQYY